MIVYYNIDRASTVGLNKEEVSVKETAITTQENVQQSIQPAIEFNSTLTKLIDQHSKEKENLFNLIENFQNKVVNLENQIKIERMNSKSWWKFW